MSRRALLVSVAMACVLAGPAAGLGTPATSSTAEIVVEEGESIQDAVDRASPGDTILVRQGTYSESIRVDKRALTLRAPDGATIDGAGITVAADDVAVDGFTIQGTSVGIATDGRVDGLELRDLTVEDTTEFGVDITVQNVTVDGVESLAAGDTGILIDADRTGTVAIVGTTVERSSSGYQDAGNGLDVTGGSEVFLEDVTVRETDATGIRVSPGSVRNQSVTIRGTEVSGPSNSGIFVTNGDTAVPGRVVVDNTSVSGSGEYGISTYARHTTVTGIEAASTGDKAVELSATRAGQLTVRNVTVRGATGGYQDTGHGVHAIGGETVVVRDIVTTDTDGHGVRVSTGDSPLQNVTLSMIEATSSGNSGAYVTGAAAGNTLRASVSDLTLEENGEYGLYTEGDEVTVENVSASDNGDTGIRVDPLPEGTVAVENVSSKRSTNEYKDNGHGVAVAGGTAVSVRDAEVAGNGGSGVVIYSDEARDRTVTLAGIDAADSGSRGVDVRWTGGDDVLTVASVSVDGSGNKGIWLAGNNVTVTDAESTNNRNTAVYLSVSAEGTAALSDIVASRSASGYKRDGHGLNVVGGTMVSVTNVSAEGNDNTNVQIEHGDARGQEVRVEAATLTSGGNNGLYVSGTSGEDSVTVLNSVARDHAGYGFSLGQVESVEIRDTRASNNDDGDLRLAGINRSEATIENSFEAAAQGTPTATSDGGDATATGAANAVNDGGSSGGLVGDLPVPWWAAGLVVIVVVGVLGRGAFGGSSASGGGSDSGATIDDGLGSDDGSTGPPTAPPPTDSTGPAGAGGSGSDSSDGEESDDWDAGDTTEDEPAGSAPAPVVADRVPDRIPGAPAVSVDYGALQNREPIGAGGNADVYRAELETPEDVRTLAIKEPRMAGDQTMGTDVIGEFLSEAETWNDIDDHDHIVDVVDWGQNGVPWIAMEYMDGGDLAARAGDLPTDQAAWTVARIAEAVGHANHHGVVHTDLKPENVLFREVKDGWDVPKVADWGLSKHLLEHSESVEGFSPRHAAPEQFADDGETGTATDVYQLGAIAYELFTGRPVFEGDTTEAMYKIAHEEPTPPSEVANVPRELDGALMPALVKDQDDRYDTAYHLRDAVERVVADD